MRAGAHPRTVVTTTPKPIRTLKEIIADPGTVVTKGLACENYANLSEKFIWKIEMAQPRGPVARGIEITFEIAQSVAVMSYWPLALQHIGVVFGGLVAGTANALHPHPGRPDASFTLRMRDVTSYTLRKCLIFRGCDGVTSRLQYARHAPSNCAR